MAINEVESKCIEKEESHDESQTLTNLTGNKY